MKKVKLFILEDCPYCHEAKRFMDALCSEHPEYKAVEIEIIDERKYPSIADAYDYYYVPTFFVGDKKVHEGASTMAKIEDVYIQALED